MRLRTIVPTIVAAAALGLASVPAGAAVNVLVAGPSSQTTGTYATPLVIADGTLTFRNQDVQAHGVRSAATGPSDQPWCGFFAAGDCPLLWAPFTDAGGREEAVLGLGNAEPGEYVVYCYVHTSVDARVLLQ